MLVSVLAICLGACVGALSRWLIGLALNPLFAPFPLGTLCVNWLGSLLLGLATAAFASCADLNQQWKLLTITGFLGSLTTFSAFAGEMAQLIMGGRLGLCAIGIVMHVGGSIAMVFAGIAIATGLKHLLA